MAACGSPSGLVDELDGAGAEVRPATAWGGRLDSAPDDLCEIARQRPLAADAEPREMEPNPPDDVVGRVRSVLGQGVVDGEQDLGADALVERVLHLGRVELGAGVREVVTEPEVVLVAVEHPVREGAGAS